MSRAKKTTKVTKTREVAGSRGTWRDVPIPVEQLAQRALRYLARQLGLAVRTEDHVYVVSWRKKWWLCTDRSSLLLPLPKKEKARVRDAVAAAQSAIRWLSSGEHIEVGPAKASQARRWRKVVAGMKFITSDAPSLGSRLYLSPLIGSMESPRRIVLTEHGSTSWTAARWTASVLNPETGRVCVSVQGKGSSADAAYLDLRAKAAALVAEVINPLLVAPALL